MMIDLQPLPMIEAQEFWRNKVPLSPGEYRRLSDEAKVQAFAISGIAKGDELATAMGAIEKAIDSGTTFQEFKNDCREIIARRGWTGDAAWRVDNIFRTNIQTAYNVGRYKQMTDPDVLKARPYWQYSAVNDRRTRPTHAALNGQVYPADHEFWQKWYPPNGYRCRCGVVTLSERDVRQDKLTVRRDDPTGKLIEPIDPTTGRRMPARLLMPDPGFANNPGRSVWGGIVDASAKPGKWEAMPNLRGPEFYRRKALANVKPADIPDFKDALLPAGKGDEFYKAAFVEQYGQEKVAMDVINEPVILSLRSFLVDKTPGAAETWKFSKGGHGESIPLMEDMLTAPFEIWLTPQKNDTTGQIRLTKRYIGLWKTADKKRIGGLAVYEVTDGVFQGVTSFIPLKGSGLPDLSYVEKQREGLLLYGKGK